MMRITTYLRNSMEEERLSGLVIISAHGREIALHALYLELFHG